MCAIWCNRISSMHAASLPLCLQALCMTISFYLYVYLRVRVTLWPCICTHCPGSYRTWRHAQQLHPGSPRQRSRPVIRAGAHSFFLAVSYLSAYLPLWCTTCVYHFSFVFIYCYLLANVCLNSMLVIFVSYMYKCLFNHHVCLTKSSK